MMLRVESIDVGYGTAQVLYGLSFSAQPGQITCLLGRNGAGKTTTLHALMGLLPLMAGEIRLGSTTISGLAAPDVVKQGIALVPQGRRLFGALSVAENIEIGLMASPKQGKTEHRRNRSRVLELFPRLKERLGQQASTLSGGEQQMLATARALCVEPQVLLLDEPTEGLQPSIAQQLRDVSRELARQGVAVVLVEQHLDTVLELADSAVLIESGRLVRTLSAEQLKNNPSLVTRHLGI